MTEEYELQKDNKLKYKNTTVGEKRDVATISVVTEKKMEKQKCFYYYTMILGLVSSIHFTSYLIRFPPTDADS